MALGLSPRLGDTCPAHRVRSDFIVLLVISNLLCLARIAKVLQQHMADSNAKLAHIEGCLSLTEEKHSADAIIAAGYVRAILLAGKDYLVQHQDSLLRELATEEEKA